MMYSSNENKICNIAIFTTLKSISNQNVSTSMYIICYFTRALRQIICLSILRFTYNNSNFYIHEFSQTRPHTTSKSGFVSNFVLTYYIGVVHLTVVLIENTLNEFRNLIGIILHRSN